MPHLPKFQALGLSADMLKVLERKGFTEPSPIQEMAIPLVLENQHDVIAQAQTGTGKTAAFAIPVLERIHALGHIQTLVMVPTRELAIQVATEINSLRIDKDLEVLAIYGGASMQDQLRSLKRGVDVVVATPGRLLDHMERKSIHLNKVAYVVLDEADEMLRMGFIDDIEAILKACPAKRRTLLFSATMPKPIMDITDKYMHDKKVVAVKKDPAAVSLTEQVYYEVRRGERLDALAQIIELEDSFYGVIFCRTKLDVDDLTKELLARSYTVEALHGDVSQSTREARLKKFKARKSTILVATDVAARGIDVTDLSHVVNYSLPQNAETYVHRIGRTGRAGKKGVAITFVAPNEYRDFNQMIRHIKAEVRKADLPKAHDVLQSKVKRIKQSLSKILESGAKKMYQDMAEELIGDQDAFGVLAALLQQSLQASVENSAPRSERPASGANEGRGSLHKKPQRGSRKLFGPRGGSDKPRGDSKDRSRRDSSGDSRDRPRRDSSGDSKGRSRRDSKSTFKSGGARHNESGFAHRKKTGKPKPRKP